MQCHAPASQAMASLRLSVGNARLSRLSIPAQVISGSAKLTCEHSICWCTGSVGHGLEWISAPKQGRNHEVYVMYPERMTKEPLAATTWSNVTAEGPYSTQTEWKPTLICLLHICDLWSGHKHIQNYALYHKLPHLPFSGREC